MIASITSLLDTLKENKIINEIKSGTIFYDEPKFPYFTATINKDLHNLRNIPFDLTVGGISASSKKTAMLKCLMECIERYSLFEGNGEYKIKSFQEVKDEALDPSLFTGSPETGLKKISWTPGMNAYSSKKILLPAQLVNLNPSLLVGEEALTTPISTGAAAGFSHESTLLGGIYEIIERDAFMSLYLNKISAPEVHPDFLNNKNIQNIVDIYKRYNLEILVFDVTHDLGIPVYVSILIDRTGIGPAITIGAKANINRNNAIIGCMEEAFMARPWIRFEMLQKRNGKRALNPSQSRLDRALLWSSQKNIRKLDFLLRHDSHHYGSKKTKKFLDRKTELSFVLESLRNNGFSVYYKDITAKEFRSIGCLVYKTIIPGLQPLYLRKEEINMRRISTLSKFFGQKECVINTFPHPFL